jgi:hypothetical protein
MIWTFSLLVIPGAFLHEIDVCKQTSSFIHPRSVLRRDWCLQTTGIKPLVTEEKTTRMHYQHSLHNGFYYIPAFFASARYSKLYISYLALYILKYTMFFFAILATDKERPGCSKIPT